MRSRRVGRQAIVGLLAALVLVAGGGLLFGVARPAAAGGLSGRDFTAFVVSDSGQALQALDAEQPGGAEKTIGISGVAPAGASFEEVAIDPTAAEALVTVANPSGVAAFSTGTGQALGFVAIPALSAPGPIAISPTGPAAVGDTAGGTLALLSLPPGAAPTVTATVSVPASEGGDSRPFVCAVAYTPSGTLFAGATYQAPSSGAVPQPPAGGASSCDLQSPVAPWLIGFGPSGQSATPLVPPPTAPADTGTPGATTSTPPTSTPAQASGPGPVAALQVAPDGNTMYAALRSSGATAGAASGEVAEVALSDLAQPGTNILPLSSVAADPTGLAISPDGSTVYVAERAPSPQIVGLGTAGGETGAAALPAPPVGVAVTPDGKNLLATTGAGVVPAPVPFAGGVAAGAPVAATTDPTALAITPDQAPVAQVAFRPASPTPGATVSFSAAGSTVRYGQIRSYVWNFGDGTPTVTTTSPATTHTYRAVGSFTVTVTETDSAGTSIAPAFASFPDDFTGQTALRSAGASAQGVVSIDVAATPPPTTATHPTTTVKPRPTTPPGTAPRPKTATRTPGTFPTTTTTVPASPGSPALTLNPGVGPPGEAVTFSGTNFPPNAQITVQWSPGVGSTVVKASATGTVTGSILVLYGDQTGPRQLTAAGFPTAVADYLVVAGDSGQFTFRR